MEIPHCGRIIKGVGGLYTVKLLDHASLPTGLDRNTPIACRAKGAFRHDNLTPLVGDIVSLEFEETGQSTRDAGALISEIAPRKNALIRPPLANLDIMFVTPAAAKPAPVLETVDKLICILEHHHITPVVVITKYDADPKYAQEICNIYRTAGFDTFVTSSKDEYGIDALKAYVKANCEDKISAFAGASGVGKSTLLNALFPSLALSTGEISRKIERGKHTTRTVELFAMPDTERGFIADTPGFSMLDFARFDFFKKEDLPLTMREFAPYLGNCRFTKCSHTKEQGCAILEAVKRGDIPPSRHQSFVAIYDVLKNKHDWDN
ncbi:MAG: ribosome small subunit-dependent GTPase A [Clostridia bacterium]|nr:ribosome small subunit-dependent GTPase A [Clostridia bacterium]MBQ7380345.1 ribosome small subunit-dependent GTPase A [Clostridia bacterium]